MYALVISREPNYRKVMVDALVARGYLAAGVCSPQEGVRLIEHRLPGVVIVYGVVAFAERLLRILRTLAKLENQPVVIISEKTPARTWMNEWGVDACLSLDAGAPAVVDEVSEWLEH